MNQDMGFIEMDRIKSGSQFEKSCSIGLQKIGLSHDCPKIGLIFSKYNHWEQPYISNWESLLKACHPEVRSFTTNMQDKGIPQLLCKSKSDALFRVFIAVTSSFNTTAKYILSTKIGEYENLIKDIANLYPLLSYVPDVLHFIECQKIGKYIKYFQSSMVKTVVSFRGGDILVNPWENPTWKDIILRENFKYINKLHFVSYYLKDQAIKLGASDEKSIVIYPGIDTDFFSTKRISGKHNPNKIRITTTARLVWEKGIDFSLSAIKMLVKKGYPIEYTIIGDGPDRRRLKYLCHHYDLDNVVKFLGKKSPMDVKNILETTDIYIQPSLSESICVSIMEACSMKLPIIASRVGGIPELISDKVNGLLVQSQNPNELAEAIIFLVDNENICKEMGTWARKIVENKFSLRDEVEKWIELYQGLVA